MTFPLGSLRADGGSSTAATAASYPRDGKRAAPPPAHSPGMIRAQFRLLVGASREMVSRVMKDLEGRGMVQTQENGWVVIKELTA